MHIYHLSQHHLEKGVEAAEECTRKQAKSEEGLAAGHDSGWQLANRELLTTDSEDQKSDGQAGAAALSACEEGSRQEDPLQTRGATELDREEVQQGLGGRGCLSEKSSRPQK